MNPGPKPQGEAKAGKPAVLSPVLSAELAAERAFGLLAPPGPILPADALLGPLEDLNSQDGKTKALLAPIRAFLDALVAGKIDPEPIRPSRLDLISLSAREVLEGPHPGAWRLGKPKVEELGGVATALAAFSLNWPAEGGKKPIWVKGELGLREEGRAWKLESLSLDPLPLLPGKEG